MREEELVAELKRKLPEILPVEGVRWWPRKRVKDHRVDAVVDLVLRGKRMVLVLEMKAHPSPGRIRDGINHVKGYAKAIPKSIPVLVAPYLSEGVRKICREAGQAYLDLSGNVWLEKGSVLIDRDGRPNMYAREPKRRNLFADKASLVFRHLVGNRGRSGGVRDISREAGVDVGQVSRVVRAAVEEGYVWVDSAGRVRLKNVPELLADWSSFYHWKHNDCEWYFCDPHRIERVPKMLAEELMGGPGRYGLSVHAGNNMVEPFADYNIWHIYVLGVAERIRESLRLERVSPDSGNIVLMEPYYRNSVFHGSRLAGDVWVVSDLQLFLDLRRYPVRGEEAAAEILEKRLKPLWEGSEGA